MRPPELLQRFIAFIPAFEARWGSVYNYHHNEDGSFTLHGLCSEFSTCFRDNFIHLSDDTFKQLFDFIELNIVEPTASETMLDNALCTCFLENISSEPCGEAAKKWMGRKSRVFFDQWHVGPPY